MGKLCVCVLVLNVYVCVCAYILEEIENGPSKGLQSFSEIRNLIKKIMILSSV